MALQVVSSDRVRRDINRLGDTQMYSSVREWGLDQIQFDLVLFDRDGVIEGPTVTPVVMLLNDPAVGYRSSVTYRLRWSGA